MELVTRSGVLVSLEQHRVGVCWGLEVGFFINRVWVVDWVAGETVNDFVVDARPPDCCEAIQGQFFLQVEQARGRQFVERLGVEDGDKGTMVDHQLKVGACKIEVRLVDGPDDCDQFDLCGGVARLCMSDVPGTTLEDSPFSRRLLLPEGHAQALGLCGVSFQPQGKTWSVVGQDPWGGQLPNHL